MTKTDKKTDKVIRAALTLACHDILAQVAGFEWLTHQVDFKRVNATLSVSCIFDTQSSQSNAIFKQQDKLMVQIIMLQLVKIGICLDNEVTQIRFDNEERLHDRKSY